MCISTYLAFVIGSFLLLANLAMLMNRPYYKRCVAEAESSPTITYTLGVIGVIIGLLVVACHNIWIREWPVLITICGWVFLLQGASRLLFPEQTNRTYKQFHGRTGYWMIVTIFMLIGIYLIWEGFQHTPSMMIRY